MAEHQLLISGVHYGANGDFVAGQKDTEETLVRTREVLSRIDRTRPVVVLSPDPSNHIHRNAIQARALGQRIGRVSYDDNEKAWKLLRQTGKPMLLARVKDVSIVDHGYVNVIVEADELQESLQPSTSEIEWRLWLSDLPLLPESEQLQTHHDVVGRSAKKYRDAASLATMAFEEREQTVAGTQVHRLAVEADARRTLRRHREAGRNSLQPLLSEHAQKGFPVNHGPADAA